MSRRRVARMLADEPEVRSSEAVGPRRCAPPPREEAVQFGTDARLVGILTLGARTGDGRTRPAVVVLNSGRVHRVGPHRLYVKLARRLARSGFPILRFDFAGIGDSGVGTRIVRFGEKEARDASAAMDFLEKRLGVDRFVILGFCRGADVGMIAAEKDRRVSGAVLVNGGLSAHVEDHSLRGQARTRTEQRYYVRRLFSGRSWSRLLSGKSNLAAVRRAVTRIPSSLKRAMMSRPSTTAQEVVSSHHRLESRGVDLLLVFSEGSVAWDLANSILGQGAKALGETPTIQLEYFDHCDHVFTPLDAQGQLMDRVESWMEAKAARWTLPVNEDPRRSTRP